MRAPAVARKYPWLADHQHTYGPWCWVLESAEQLTQSVPWRGAQGLFEIDPRELLIAAGREICRQSEIIWSES